MYDDTTKNGCDIRKVFPQLVRSYVRPGENLLALFSETLKLCVCGRVMGEKHFDNVYFLIFFYRAAAANSLDGVSCPARKNLFNDQLTETLTH